MAIRDATVADLPAIVDLYNRFVLTRAIAWTEALQTLDERVGWFERQQAAGFPVLVAEVDGAVLGFAAYGHFRGAGKWPGYDRTVEHTIHVGEEAWGRGLGRALLEELVARARSAGMHVMVAAIDGENEESMRFHARLGFVEVARMPEVGHKFGRWLDLVLMQRVLDEREGV